MLFSIHEDENIRLGTKHGVGLILDKTRDCLTGSRK